MRITVDLEVLPWTCKALTEAARTLEVRADRERQYQRDIEMHDAPTNMARSRLDEAHHRHALQIVEAVAGAVASAAAAARLENNDAG